jgi:hypothetical protein
MARQYVVVKFRLTDQRTYTYHFDGEAVAAGDEVTVEDNRGDGWKRVFVTGVTAEAPSFPTKPIMGVYRDPEERRDFDAVEREMIRQGDRPGAKTRWHLRTGR